jgi:hypothetical protein
MTVCARDDKVGLSPFSGFHQSGCNVTRPALDAMKYGVDPVMLEVIDGIGTHDDLLLAGCS